MLKNDSRGSISCTTCGKQNKTGKLFLEWEKRIFCCCCCCWFPLLPTNPVPKFPSKWDQGADVSDGEGIISRAMKLNLENYRIYLIASPSSLWVTYTAWVNLVFSDFNSNIPIGLCVALTLIWALCCACRKHNQNRSHLGSNGMVRTLSTPWCCPA